MAQYIIHLSPVLALHNQNQFYSLETKVCFLFTKRNKLLIFVKHYIASKINKVNNMVYNIVYVQLYMNKIINTNPNPSHNTNNNKDMINSILS